MAKYHAYVFDQEQRRFIGEFEEMYKAGELQQFDSWYQEDLRNLSKQICLDILGNYNFDRVLDVGCGKGVFTQFLKKANNQVLALDLSETALKIARGKFPDIDFQRADINCGKLKQDNGEKYDLVVCLETLSYIEQWPSLLASFAWIGRYVLIVLFIPEDPIGFVKSFDDLRDSFRENYSVIEEIHLINREQIILFGESKFLDTQPT